MGAAFSESQWLELRMQFEERRVKQLLLMKSHEADSTFGMAYLALWAVLEFFAKRLGPVAQRRELKEALSEWLVYLNTTGANAPAKIGIGKFDVPKLETAKIPPEATLQILFPLIAGPSFYQAIATKEKYRNRRNDIAHKAEAPSLRVYEDFKELALKALAEIDAWLLGEKV